MNPSNNEEVLISADSHVLELPDLWEKPLAGTFGDRAPRVYFDDKRESWMFGSPEVPAQAVGFDIREGLPPIPFRVTKAFHRDSIHMYV